MIREAFIENVIILLMEKTGWNNGEGYISFSAIGRYYLFNFDFYISPDNKIIVSDVYGINEFPKGKNKEDFDSKVSNLSSITIFAKGLQINLKDKNVNTSLEMYVKIKEEIPYSNTIKSLSNLDKTLVQYAIDKFINNPIHNVMKENVRNFIMNNFKYIKGFGNPEFYFEDMENLGSHLLDILESLTDKKPEGILTSLKSDYSVIDIDINSELFVFDDFHIRFNYSNIHRKININELVKFIKEGGKIHTKIEEGKGYVFYLLLEELVKSGRIKDFTDLYVAFVEKTSPKIYEVLKMDKKEFISKLKSMELNKVITKNMQEYIDYINDSTIDSFVENLFKSICK